MKPKFNEAKATQVACRILELRGGRMSYLKLIKLMYLIDRTALIRWGRPVTFDHIVSMDNGLVLSRVYNLILEDARPDTPSFWRKHISEPRNREVEKVAEGIEYDELSDVEDELILELFDKYGEMSRWQLVDDIHHNLPEWTNPNGTSIPLTFKDILVKSREKSISEILEIEDELNSIAILDNITLNYVPH